MSEKSEKLVSDVKLLVSDAGGLLRAGTAGAGEKLAQLEAAAAQKARLAAEKAQARMSAEADALEQAVPWKANYKHSEGNAAAHAKASLMGSSVQVIVEEGLLRLGTWQAIYFCEFDGPRSRDIWIQQSN